MAESPESLLGHLAFTKTVSMAVSAVMKTVYFARTNCLTLTVIAPRLNRFWHPVYIHYRPQPGIQIFLFTLHLFILEVVSECKCGHKGPSWKRLHLFLCRSKPSEPGEPQHGHPACAREQRTDNDTQPRTLEHPWIGEREPSDE